MDEAAKLKRLIGYLNDRRLIAPLPWRVHDHMVWDDTGDAIVSSMPGGQPYFDPPVAEFIALASRLLPALLKKENP